MDRLKNVPWHALEGLVDAVLPALTQTLHGQTAERVVDGWLRQHRHLTAPQRTAVVEAIYGVAIFRRRLAHHAGSDHPRSLLMSLLCDLAEVPEDCAARWLGLPNLQPRCQSRPDPPGIRLSFPDWLVQLLQHEFGDRAVELMEALNLPGPVFLRANTLKTTPAELAEALAAEGVATQPCTYAPHGLRVEGPRPNIYGLHTHRNGWFEVQDEGSQLLGTLVDAQPGFTVIDWCAGAGGKTLQLAAHMGNQGQLLAHDPDRTRLVRLVQRARRAGVTCVSFTDEPPIHVKADRVLVDAPCSQLGALRRGPDQRFAMHEVDLDLHVETQREILRQAACAVRPGGRLVYATCTWRHQENQDVVRAFLQTHPDFRMLAPPVAPELTRDGFLFTAPHLHGTDGFFGAVLARGE